MEGNSQEGLTPPYPFGTIGTHMGYYINTRFTSFAILTKNLPRFFDLVDNLMSDKNIKKHGNGGSWQGNTQMKSWFSWVNTDAVRKASANKDIVAVFDEWGYELTLLTDECGVSAYSLNIRNGNAKIGDEEKFFAAIAPVVEDGSFIDVVGEDDQEWRWMWENGKFFSQNIIEKNIVFGEPNEIKFSGIGK